MKEYSIKLGTYKGERVTVLARIGNRTNIWIPSRQEEIWVLNEKLESVIVKPVGTA